MFAVLSAARKGLARLSLLFSAAWLAACEPIALSDAGGGPSINPSAPVTVALLVPRGSGSAADDLLARNLENAARMAVSDAQGARIDLRVYATAGNAAQAQTAARNAVADGAKIIIGPLYAEAANAAAVAVADKRVNVLAFSNNASIAGGNLFILGHTFQNTANRLAGFAARQGKTRILAVHANDVAGQTGRQAIADAVARNGAKLVGSVGYDLSQQGVISAVPRIKAAAVGGQADALFLTSNTAGALPLFSQLLPEAGLGPSMTQYIGLTRWDIPTQTLDLPGVQGGWFALPDPGVSARFNGRYAAAYGTGPHPVASLAYDGVAAITALVAQGKRDALTGGALTQSAGFRGANGVFRLRPNGTNERGLAVASIRDRQVVVLDPAPKAFGGAGF